MSFLLRSLRETSSRRQRTSAREFPEHDTALTGVDDDEEEVRQEDAKSVGSSSTRFGNRIPKSLQAVFLASNSGADVNTIAPPPNGVGSKLFRSKSSLLRNDKQKKTISESSSNNRIPSSLQAVFLASNGGADVNTIEPPPNGEAFKVFGVRGLFRNKNKKKKNKSSKTKDLQETGGTESTPTPTNSAPSVAPSKSSFVSKSFQWSRNSSKKLKKKTSSQQQCMDNSCTSITLFQQSTANIIEENSIACFQQCTTTAAANIDDNGSQYLQQSTATIHENCSTLQQQQQQQSTFAFTIDENDTITLQKNAATIMEDSCKLQAMIDEQPLDHNNNDDDDSTVPPPPPSEETAVTDLDALLESIIPTIPPQQYLDTMLVSRGYSITRYDTLETAYWNEPTDLQLASYQKHLLDLVRERDVEELRALITSGISLNPCNPHGESLMHNLCRMNDAELVLLFLVAGATLQVSDDCGRTPLHDACWASSVCAVGTSPNFTLIDLILKVDVQLLFLKDKRGNTPLSYIRFNHWCDWVRFFVSKRDVYWPLVTTTTTDTDSNHQSSNSSSYNHLSFVSTEQLPSLVDFPPDSRPVSDPPNALSPRLASLVAAGKVPPTDIQSVMDAEEGRRINDDDYDEGEEEQSILMSEDASIVCIIDSDDDENESIVCIMTDSDDDEEEDDENKTSDDNKTNYKDKANDKDHCKGDNEADNGKKNK